jgi:hypothetical protein
MRFFATILLAAMVLNIGKYQLPYIEYYFFKDYIAKNLCVKRNEAHNCCHGKCHLAKQIKQVNETEDNSNNPTEKKLSNTQGPDDYIFMKTGLPMPVSFIEMKLSTFTNAQIATGNLTVIVPPPKNFV